MADLDLDFIERNAPVGSWVPALVAEVRRVQAALDGIGSALVGFQCGDITEADAWREVEVNLRAVTGHDPGLRPGYVIVSADEVRDLRAVRDAAQEAFDEGELNCGNGPMSCLASRPDDPADWCLVCTLVHYLGEADR